MAAGGFPFGGILEDRKRELEEIYETDCRNTRFSQAEPIKISEMETSALTGCRILRIYMNGTSCYKMVSIS